MRLSRPEYSSRKRERFRGSSRDGYISIFIKETIIMKIIHEQDKSNFISLSEILVAGLQKF